MQSSLQEGQRRRGNIIDKLMMEISGILIATQTQISSVQERIELGRAFISDHKTSLDMFTQASSPQILYDVDADDNPDHSWVDDHISETVTIREYIISSMNIWGLTI